MQKCVLILSLIGMMAAQECIDLNGQGDQWCYSVSMNQSFYMFENITIDGQSAVVGEDILSSWYNGVLIGWNIVEAQNTTVVVMGNDGLEPHLVYPAYGDGPIIFKIYDFSNEAILNAYSFEEIPTWQQNTFNVLSNLDSENAIKAITKPLVRKKDIRSPSKTYEPPKSVSNSIVLEEIGAMNEERGSFTV